MYCVKYGKAFPWQCTCDDKEERLASLSGKVIFQLPDGKMGTPAPVQPKQKVLNQPLNSDRAKDTAD